MNRETKNRAMCGVRFSLPCLRLFLLVTCYLVLLFHKEILGCSSVCQLCTGRQINCRNLGLSSIPKNFPESTVFLYLTGNNISHINESELTGLHSLVALHLDNSSIVYVYPKAFVHLRHLYFLYLNNNFIKRLDPGIFEGLSNLRNLYLQSNQVSFVPRGVFRDLVSVQYLNLQRNRLTVLGSGTFVGMIALRILDLSNNKILRISDSGFQHLGNLDCLYLEDLHPRVLKPLSSLIHLQADSNPWECSCRLLSLRDWLASSAITLNIFCQNPPSMRGRALHYVKWTDFTNCVTSSANVSRTWAITSLHIYHKTTTLMMAWHKITTNGKRSENTESVTFGERIRTSPASRFFQENTFGNPLQTTAMLPVQIQRTSPVNLNLEKNSALPIDAASVSGKTSPICTQEVEKLNEAFDILLAFFILACVLIVFLIYKVVQFKQKLKAPENSGENRLEYYSFYQSARYNVTASICNTSPNSVESPGLEQIQLHKQIVPESEAQVILFEHSAL